MKISKFEVIGLFDLYNHILDFEIDSDNASSDDKASVIMLFGSNGIGKTTILRMIDGLMTLDFDIFSISKFRKACCSLPYLCS